MLQHLQEVLLKATLVAAVDSLLVVEEEVPSVAAAEVPSADVKKHLLFIDVCDKIINVKKSDPLIFIVNDHWL